jgi:hypothetical protein
MHDIRYILYPYYRRGYHPTFLSDQGTAPHLLLALHTLGHSYEHTWRPFWTRGSDVLASPPLFTCAPEDLAGPARLKTVAAPSASSQQPPAKKAKSDLPAGKIPAVLTVTSKPLLRFADGVATDRRSRKTIASFFSSHKTLIPKMHDADGKRQTKQSQICFAFLVDSLGCSCTADMRAKFCHIDLADPQWTRSRCIELATSLANPDLAKLLVPTPAGSEFLGQS